MTTSANVCVLKMSVWTIKHCLQISSEPLHVIGKGQKNKKVRRGFQVKHVFKTTSISSKTPSQLRLCQRYIIPDGSLTTWRSLCQHARVRLDDQKLLHRTGESRPSPWQPASIFITRHPILWLVTEKKCFLFRQPDSPEGVFLAPARVKQRLQHEYGASDKHTRPVGAKQTCTSPDPFPSQNV